MDEGVSTADTIISSSYTNDTLEKTDKLKLSAGTDNAGTLSQNNNENPLSSEDTNGTFTDLNLLIKSLRDGDTLILDKNYVYNSTSDSSLNNGFTISKSITIDGNGIYSITGTNKIFTINSKNVVLQNINFINSNNVIVWNGANGKIINSQFTNCEQLFIYGADLVINKSRFIGKTRTGGIYLIECMSDSTKVLNSNFTDFNATFYFKTEAYSTNTLLKNCTFKGNSVDTQPNQYYDMISFYGMGDIEDCKFYINFPNPIKPSGTNNGFNQVIGASAPVNIRNCYIDAPGARNVISFESTLTRVYNTIFKNMKSITEFYDPKNNQFMVRTGSLFDNCTFENLTGDYAITLGYSGITIKNSRFIDCKSAILMITTVMSSKDYSPDYCIVDNCNFTNSNPKTASTPVVNVQNGVHVQLNNLKFVNTNSDVDINVSSGVSIKISNITNSSMVINKGVDFKAEHDLWVTNDSNAQGNGTSRDDLCNLTYALEMIDYNGVIHFTQGVYNDITTQKSILANLIGEDKNVIINQGSFYLLTPAAYIKNITFNNTQEQFILQQYNEVINCNFTNISKTHTLITTGPGSYHKKDLIKDCYFINVKNNNLFGGANYMAGNIMDNIHIISSTIQNIMASGSSFSGANTLRNVFFTDSTTTSRLATLYGRNNRIENVSIYNSVFFSIAELNTAGIYNNITVNNCTSTVGNTGYLFGSGTDSEYNLINITKLIFNNNGAFIFKFGSDGLVLSNSIFSNMNHNSLWAASKVYTLNNVTISNVNTTSSLFAIVDGLELDNLTVKNLKSDTILDLKNQVILSDGVFDHVKGSLIISGNNVKLNKISFTDCQVTASESLIMVNGNHTRFNNDIFFNNHGVNGGAVYINANDTNFKNCSFYNNTVSGKGGAIYSSKTIYLLIDKNSAKNLTILDEGVEDTSKNNTVWIYHIIPTYEHIYVYLGARDHASSDGLSYHTNSLSTAFGLVTSGGTIYANGTGELLEFTLNDELTKQDLTIIGNNTYLCVKKPIIIGVEGTGLTLKGINFENSTGFTAITWNGENGIINNCTFKNNKNTAGGIAGAINVKGDNLQIIKTKFINNAASADEYSIGGAICVNASNIVIKDSLFDGNDGIDGSHIYVDYDGFISSIMNSTFANGKSSLSTGGSGILNNGIINTISDCNFTHNAASNGAALYMSGIGNILLKGNNFTNNSADNNGGAIYLKQGGLTINNNKFSNNTAVNGGAIYSIISLSIVDSVFTDNNASGNGGAIFANNGLSLDTVEFVKNSATNGGALYLNNGITMVNSVQFNDNTVSGEGSAVYINIASVTLKHADLSGNVDPDMNCAIHVEDGSISVPDSDLNLGSDQKIHLTNYVTDVLYVSPHGQGYGLTKDDAASLNNDLLGHLNDGGRVIFLNNDGEVYSLDPVTISNLHNIVFVGNSTTIQLNNKDKKSLFNNHLHHIRSCS